MYQNVGINFGINYYYGNILKEKPISWILFQYHVGSVGTGVKSFEFR